MFKRNLWAIWPAVALLLAISACGGSRPPVTITWAFPASPAEAELYRRAGDAFMAVQPAIKIDYLAVPPLTYFAEIQTRWANGPAPDVALWSPTPRDIAAGRLEKLDDWLAQSNQNLDDYWPALRAAVTIDGGVYGLPRRFNPQVLYYNRAMFDAAGLAYPTANWSWADLQAAADQLTQVDAGGRVARYGLAATGSNYRLWVEQNRGRILDDWANPAKCALADSPTRDAITFWAGLMNRNLAMPDALLSQAGGAAAVFRDGRAAMIVQDAGPLAVFNAAGLKYDVAPLPLPTGGQREVSATADFWVISAGSANKAAAWEFLSWLQSANGGQKIYAETGAIFPARLSVANSAAFLATGQPPANRPAFIAAAETAHAEPYFPDWAELEGTIITPGLQRIWAGEATPSEALPQICRQVDAFLARHGYPHQ